jgi:ferredoxin--NADP+ reductase
MIFRAVGYQALPLPDVPFDEASAVIPHSQGRVRDGSGQLAKGEYVTGWAKRGPSGTIGTNKSDSAETVCNLLADLAAGVPYKRIDPEAILAVLDDRGVDYTNWVNWLRLDDHEIALGRGQGRPRVKVHTLRSMLELCRGPHVPGAADGKV